MTYKLLTAADKQYLMTSAVATAKSSTTIQDYIRKASQFSPEELNQIPQFKSNLLEAAKQDAVSAAMVLMCDLQTSLSIEERKDLFLQYAHDDEFEVYMATHAIENVEEAISIFTNHFLGTVNLADQLVSISMDTVFNAYKNHPKFIQAIITAKVVDSALPTYMDLMYEWRRGETFNRMLAADESLLPKILTNIVAAAKSNTDSAILILTCRYAQLLSNMDLLAIYKAHHHNSAFVKYITTHYLVGGAYLLPRAATDVALACELLKTDFTSILQPIAIYNNIYAEHRRNPEFLAFIDDNLTANTMRLPALLRKAPALIGAINSSHVMPDIYETQKMQLQKQARDESLPAPGASTGKAEKRRSSFFATTAPKPLQSIKAATERVVGSIASQSPRVPRGGC